MLRLCRGEAAEMSGPRAALDQRGGPDQERERSQLRQSSEPPAQRSDGAPAGISPREAADFAAEAERLRREATYHLRDRPISDADNWRLQNELGWHDDRGNLLRFLDDPSIEPTNNRAERALRGAVIARKVSHCSKNVGGADAFSAFTSVSGPWLGMAAITRWSTGSAVCSAVLGPHTFLLNPSSHSPPLINYGDSFVAERTGVAGRIRDQFRASLASRANQHFGANANAAAEVAITAGLFFEDCIEKRSLGVAMVLNAPDVWASRLSDGRFITSAAKVL